MKRFAMSVVLIAMVCAGVPLLADELPSCDDLAELANTLEDMEADLKQVGTVTEGDEVDSALGEVVESLSVVAEVEGDSDLGESVDRLSAVWEEMDGGGLLDALHDVIGDFDVIIDKECVD